jgi:hypothetical protein
MLALRGYEQKNMNAGLTLAIVNLILLVYVRMPFDSETLFCYGTW